MLRSSAILGLGGLAIGIVITSISCGGRAMNARNDELRNLGQSARLWEGGRERPEGSSSANVNRASRIQGERWAWLHVCNHQTINRRRTNRAQDPEQDVRLRVDNETCNH